MQFGRIILLFLCSNFLYKKNVLILQVKNFKIMNIEVLKSKIHRVKVTQADLNYIGSITIDEELMQAANIIENERVYIYNINTGARFDTYAIKGEKGSGVIGLNGAAARLAQINDLVIIVSFASMDFEQAKSFKPTVIFPKNNHL